MKNNIFISILIASILSLLSFSNCSTTLPSTDSWVSSIKEKIDSQHFTFVAESVTPLRESKRFLTSSYDVYVSKDSLVAFLPYFGRATIAPINSNEGGIKFTSTNFSYEASQSKSNRWKIVLKPKDIQDVLQLNFIIFNNGSASLQVTSTSRDLISFEGQIK